MRCVKPWAFAGTILIDKPPPDAGALIDAGLGQEAHPGVNTKEEKVRRLTIAVLSLLGFVSPAWADFDDGMTAYRAKDFELAFQEFKAEAIKGHQTAQFNIGVMYYRGEGVDKDLVRAFSWIELSTERGDLLNIEAEEVLILMLTPDQIRDGYATAAVLAKEYSLTYTPPDLEDLGDRLTVMDDRSR
jgi:hypothetical protein